MKPHASVFLKAAENLVDFACLSLNNDNEVDLFQELLKPNKSSKYDGWYGEFTPENQLARQLGLLICAEVLKDEQRKRK